MARKKAKKTLATRNLREARERIAELESTLSFVRTEKASADRKTKEFGEALMLVDELLSVVSATNHTISVKRLEKLVKKEIGEVLMSALYKKVVNEEDDD